LADLPAGTGFGKFENHKSMRLSNRNILLVIGIVVAVVVTLTTLVYQEKVSAEKRDVPVPIEKKTSLDNTAKRVIEFMSRQVSSQKIH
jgi:hypothetical protein